MRIGAVTLCSLRGRNQENLEKIVRFGAQAAELGCRLVLFPELSVCGPWVSYDPGARLDDLVRQAEPIPGPTTEFLLPHARRLGIAFGVGVAEAGLASKPFNTLVIVDRTGVDGVLHRQRKLQPTVSEVGFFRGGGDDVRPFTLEGVSFGTIICADNGHARLYEHLTAQGAGVILAPHAGAIKKYEHPGSSWEELLAYHRRERFLRYPARAAQYGVALVYTDAKDPRQNFDDLPEWPHYVSGKSGIFDPQGRIVAENAGNEESLIIANLEHESGDFIGGSGVPTMDV